MIDIFFFDKKLKKRSPQSLSRYKNDRGFLWIDLTTTTKNDARAVAKALDLHPLTEEDLLHNKMRSKVEEFPKYLFCVFYALRYDKGICLDKLDFILGKRFLVTAHAKRVSPYKELKKDTEKISAYMKKGPDYFLQYLLHTHIDNYTPAIEAIDEEMAKIEEHIIKNPTPQYVKQILHLKRDVITIKKIMIPQREVIGSLTRNNYSFISKSAIPYFRDVHDHSIRIADAIENSREAIASTFEMYMSTVSNNMNEVMKVLSIIATIALPLTVISGIYGTNFIYLPGSKTVQGFWVMILFMGLLCIFMMYFFRRKGWV